MNIEVWQFILILVFELLVVAIATFFISRKVFSNQIKKNPPINEKMIRAMFMQMGRKPSETQIKQVMNSMNKYK